ncbi:MAG: mitochondrial fission ELM1 family protein [Gammaproteobacteria bacterium]|nr:mitochondrial fission ELM1 family protein [Gammaproteobacteria bacterium]
MTAPIVVWAFTDGKAGHENQTRGLIAALARLTPLDIRWIKAPPYSSILTNLMTKRFLPGAALPSPDLLIGAGHRTHLPMIAARRARGGRSIVLMKPSLPRVWFDLAVIPEHDRVSGDHVFVTRGALNAVQPGEKGARSGLILIGGPSRHHGWRENELLAQVEAVVKRDNKIQWTLTSSRRTPPSTLARLAGLKAKNLDVVPVAKTGPEWLPSRLATARQAWVTEDSVSMVYEALTAGCATGILAVPARGRSRAQKKLQLGMESLVADKLVTRHADWQAGASLAPANTPFNEAARVAEWIHHKWLAA